METGVYSIIVALVICFPVFLSVTEARQMCWTCQYVQNWLYKEECSRAPGDWTGGDPRMRCLSSCFISAEFDAGTGELIFLYRGCEDSIRKNGCTSFGNKDNCYFSCNDNHYCNDRNVSTSLKFLDTDGASKPMQHNELIIIVVINIVCSLYIKFI